MKAILRWSVSHSVFANLCMLFLIMGGLMWFSRIQQEIFPEVELDKISITVVYPGASPSEIEEGIILPIEEALSGIENIKDYTSTAREGNASVVADLKEYSDPEEMLQEIKSAVDRIQIFPRDIEKPVIMKLTNQFEVLQLILSGDQPRHILKAYREKLRDRLLLSDHISQVSEWGISPAQINVRVSEQTIRELNMSWQDIASRLRNISIDLAGGVFKQTHGEMVLKVANKKTLVQDLSSIPIVTTASGHTLKLSDVATIEEVFEDNGESALFNGKNAMGLRVFRVGEESPLKISREVANVIEEWNHSPYGQNITLSLWKDSTDLLRGRMDLLIRNARFGLILVFIVLVMFLEFRLAFWVTMGIPVSFLGTFMFLPAYDVTINMISLFAFILVLGIVVDDAIVVGENIYVHKLKKDHSKDSIVQAVMEVMSPVFFTIMTTAVTFMPMFFVKGLMGKFFWPIPAIVITVLAISLFEAFFILPAHLAHIKVRTSGKMSLLDRFEMWKRRVVNQRIEYFIQHKFFHIVAYCLHHRFLTIALGISVLILSVGLMKGGVVKFTFFPRIEGQSVMADFELPIGTSMIKTQEIARQLNKTAMNIIDSLNDRAGKNTLQGILARTNTNGGAHTGQVEVVFVPSEERDFPLKEFSDRWRQDSANILDSTRLSFSYAERHGGVDIEAEISHKNEEVLDKVSKKMLEILREFDGVYNYSLSHKPGMPEVEFTLNGIGRVSGLTEADMAGQLKAYGLGNEAYRFLRGRDEVRVYVKPDTRGKMALHNLYDQPVTGKNAMPASLSQLTDIHLITDKDKIYRRNGRRIVTVSAEVDETVSNTQQILPLLLARFNNEILPEYPATRISFEGQNRDRAESVGSLMQGFKLAMVGIFFLLAILFNSYSQPLLVMFAIPFGFIGALAGHLIMGFDISLMSMMGIVALSGVVVNDSLILIEFINKHRKDGKDLTEAIINGTVSRFRPILLTSLTTFFGLLPMIFETSRQARFLIPMAISLSFGVMFATLITLLLLPCVYSVLDEIKTRLSGLFAS